MSRPWFVVALLLLSELCVILFFVPNEWLGKQIVKEAQYLERDLGEKTHAWIYTRAERWFNELVIESGMYKEIHETFIPTQEEKEKSRGMQTMGGWWFNVLESRLEVVMSVFFFFLVRCALFMTWAPYMMLLLIPATYDGWSTWMVNRANFDYASPVLHRYGVRGAAFLLMGLVVALLSPVALSPLMIPLVMIGTCALLMLSQGSLQRKV